MVAVNKESDLKNKLSPKRRFLAAAKSLFILQVLVVVVLLCLYLRQPLTPKRHLHPGIKRLVNDIDRFLWSRFRTDAILDAILADTAGDVKVGLREGIPPNPRGEDKGALDFCPALSPLLKGGYDLSQTEANQESIKNFNPMVAAGGRYTPADCQSRHKVAFIVPFWGESVMLRRFLGHMHVIWQRQQLDYKVYVVSQGVDTPRNRGRLLNAGFAVATSDDTFDCYVFHDVNLLLGDDRCIYACPELSSEVGSPPVQLAHEVDGVNRMEMGYDLSICSPMPYQVSRVIPLDGVMIFTKEQFIALNGFSNSYWGKNTVENDDLYLRTWKQNYKLEYPQNSNCQYRDMNPKQKDKSVKKSPLEYLLLKQSIHRQQKDGLRNIRYKVTGRAEEALYTEITIDVGRPSTDLERLSSVTDHWFSSNPDPGCVPSLTFLYHNLPKYNFTKV